MGEFVMGSGVKFLCSAPDGTIWVGHSDEGILSEGGISIGGIVQFAPDGAAKWSFGQGNLGLDEIWGCDALTLAGNTVWATYEHPIKEFRKDAIVRISDGLTSEWPLPVSYAGSLAVDGNDILLAGHYGEDADRLSLVRVDLDQLHQIGEIRLPLMGPAAFVGGRDDTLHIIGQGRWTRVTVANVRELLGEVGPKMMQKS